jgi:hypothetical protein
MFSHKAGGSGTVHRRAPRLILGLTLVLSGSGAFAAGEHAPIAAPAVTVGDSWTYRYTDVWKNQPGSLNRIEVTAVTDTDILVDIKRAATGALLSQQRFSHEMNPIDRGKMHFAPAFGRYSFPLAPGKEWMLDATGKNEAAGKRWRYQFKGKVLNWEKITVPAGDFDVLKIELVAFYQGEEVGRMGGSGQLKETVWFAPAVNNFVRLEYRDTNWQGTIFNRDMWELTAYTRK